MGEIPKLLNLCNRRYCRNPPSVDRRAESPPAPTSSCPRRLSVAGRARASCWGWGLTGDLPPGLGKDTDQWSTVLRRSLRPHQEAKGETAGASLPDRERGRVAERFLHRAFMAQVTVGSRWALPGELGPRELLWDTCALKVDPGPGYTWTQPGGRMRGSLFRPDTEPVPLSKPTAGCWLLVSLPAPVWCSEPVPDTLEPVLTRHGHT